MLVHCVICKAQFLQEEAEHLPDRDPAKRWTCGRVCQKRLELAAMERQQDEGTRLRAAEPEPEVSEAEEARQALAARGLQPAHAVPERADLFGDSSPAECAAAAAHLIRGAGELSAPEDRMILLSLAEGFLGRAIAGHEAELGLEVGEEEEPEKDRAPPPEMSAVYLAPSATKPGTTYEVTLFADPKRGALCTCEAAKHHKGCQHIRAAKAGLLSRKA